MIFDKSFFAYIVMGEVIAIFDGATLFCLLIFHYKNFSKPTEVEFGSNLLASCNSSEIAVFLRCHTDESESKRVTLMTHSDLAQGTSPSGYKSSISDNYR